MGFDYAPGDMLASLVAAGLGPIDEITLAYTMRGFAPTRGTTLSALEMMKGGDVELRDGELVPCARSVGRGRFDFPSPIGSRRVGRYMSGEQITVPRHVEVQNVKTVIDLRALLPLPGPAEALSAAVLNASGRAMETPLRGAVGKLVARLPEGPSEADRKAVRFTIVCEARTAGATRRGVVRGSDVYGITSVMLSRGSAADGRSRLRGKRCARAVAGLRSGDLHGGAGAARSLGRGRGSSPADGPATTRRRRTPARPAGRRLFGWTAAHDPIDRGRKIVLDRCEVCGMAVTRAAGPPDPDLELAAMLERLDGGELEVTVPNRRSIQSGIGGAQWAGLEPELRRLHLTPDALRRLLAKRGYELGKVKTPFTRESRAADVADDGQRLHPARQLPSQREGGPDPPGHLEGPLGVPPGSPGHGPGGDPSRPLRLPTGGAGSHASAAVV